MKKKLMAVLACAMAAVGLLPASASAAPAATQMALNNNPAVTITAGSCTMEVDHGEYTSALRFSRMYNPSATPTCRGDSFVELVSSTNTSNLDLAAQRCHVDTSLDTTYGGHCSVPYGSPGKIYQANIIGAVDISGSRFHICSLSGVCKDYRFAVQTASPAHFVDITRDYEGCEVDFTQGVFGTAAYARINDNPVAGGCNPDETYVELSYITDAGVLGTERCYLNSSLNDATNDPDGFCSTYSGWTQAQLDGPTGQDPHVVRSFVKLCGDGLDCPNDPGGSFLFRGF